MVDENQIAASKAIQRRTGRTFHLATRVLPKRVRWPTYVLYAFFRLADEIVDGADRAPPGRQREQLERLRAAALGEVETDHPVLSAFREVREEYGVADADVDAFVDAMATDITKDRYATHAELKEYMRGSSVAVGRMMTAIMRPDDPERALPHAAALGEAFQLTNFLRDVREDVVERDRIYLPERALRKHGVSYEQIEELSMSDGFARLIDEELERTEHRYREGIAGIEYLPEDCQFAVLLAAVLYVDHHRLIRGHDFDVLTNEPTLGTARKIRLFAETRWRWFRTKDPSTVFYRVNSAPTLTHPSERDHREAHAYNGSNDHSEVRT
ncbi:phytoene/squalene synthase family protein [Halegenticoccus soli]|uniref:phytoene/squalene synthase family protein n=1 Tax=Halegenticoccus soli TaxID=1985678 RepID=UPI000C6CE145|nr:phytoene/squalene synthase family protein [Halegenticoccus soli]